MSKKNRSNATGINSLIAISLAGAVAVAGIATRLYIGTSAPAQKIWQVSAVQASLDLNLVSEFASKYGVRGSMKNRYDFNQVDLSDRIRDALAEEVKRQGIADKVASIFFDGSVHGIYAIPSDSSESSESMRKLVEAAAANFEDYFHGVFSFNGVSVNVPSKIDEVKFKSDGLEIYLLKDAGHFEDFAFRIVLKDGSTRNNGQLLTGPKEGQSFRTFESSGNKLTKFFESPIYLSMQSPYSVIQSAGFELLHRYFSAVTFKHMTADFAAGYREGYASEVLDEVRKKWFDREEQVVHAVVFEWLNSYALQGGFSEAEVARELAEQNSRYRYRHVLHFFNAFPRKDGKLELMRKYQESPEMLFSGLE